MRKKTENATPVELIDPKDLDKRLKARIEEVLAICKPLDRGDKNLRKGLKLVSEYRSHFEGKETKVAARKKEKLIQKIDKDFPQVLSALNMRVIRTNYTDYEQAKKNPSQENNHVIAGLYLSLKQNVGTFLEDTNISTQHRAEALKILAAVDVKSHQGKSTVEEKPLRVKTSEGRYGTNAPSASPAPSPMPQQELESPRGENLSPRGEEDHSSALSVQSEKSALNPLQQSQENSPQYLELVELSKHCHESKEKSDQFVEKAVQYILDEPDDGTEKLLLSALILGNFKIKGPKELLDNIYAKSKAQNDLSDIAVACSLYFDKCDSHAKESDLRKYSAFHEKELFKKDKNTLVEIAFDYIMNSKDSVLAFNHVVELFTALSEDHGKISKLRNSEILAEIEKDVNDAGIAVKRFEDPGKK